MNNKTRKTIVVDIGVRLGDNNVVKKEIGVWGSMFPKLKGYLKKLRQEKKKSVLLGSSHALRRVLGSLKSRAET